jgi:hypothetical protein
VIYAKGKPVMAVVGDRSTTMLYWSCHDPISVLVAMMPSIGIESNIEKVEL